MTSTLLAHCGSRLGTREELDLIKAPEPTSTWFPVDHSIVIDTVSQALIAAGFQIERMKFAVSRTEDARLFAAETEAPENGTPQPEVPPQSDTNGEGNKPIMLFSYPVARDTYVQASIWERVVTLKDGNSFVTHEVSVRKRYKQGEEWKSAHSFRVSELYALAHAVAKAEAYILDLRHDKIPF